MVCKNHYQQGVPFVKYIQYLGKDADIGLYKKLPDWDIAECNYCGTRYVVTESEILNAIKKGNIIEF